jgi:hypothetical protein
LSLLIDPKWLRSRCRALDMHQRRPPFHPGAEATGLEEWNTFGLAEEDVLVVQNGRVRIFFQLTFSTLVMQCEDTSLVRSVGFFHLQRSKLR